MQIHELTQRPKKINEDLKSFLGLNNAAVSQAWDEIGGQLMQDLAARYTKDPKYANMPLAQRKKAMAADNNIQQIGKKKYGEWNQYISALQAKSPTPLTDDQYKAAFINWANQSLFNNEFSKLDAAAKAQAERFFTQFASYRNAPEPKKTQIQSDFIKLLMADETARMVQAATDLQKIQAAMAQQTPAQPQQTTASPGYAGATYNVPTTSTPGQAQQATQPAGYGGTTYNVPTSSVPQVKSTSQPAKLKPQDVKKIAANVSKAPA